MSLYSKDKNILSCVFYPVNKNTCIIDIHIFTDSSKEVETNTDIIPEEKLQELFWSVGVVNTDIIPEEKLQDLFWSVGVVNTDIIPEEKLQELFWSVGL